MTFRREVINWVGLTTVGGAAAILTFNTLRSLAESCGFTGWLGWLLPVSVDAAGAVATNVWLTGRDSPEAVRFARAWAVIAAGVSIMGNATEHGLAAYRMAPPWWVAVCVAVIPPLALVGTVHLMVLLSKVVQVDEAEVPVAAETPALPRKQAPAAVAEKAPAPDESADEEVLAKVVEYITLNGRVGRGVLARELNITQHQARQALAATNGHLQ